MSQKQVEEALRLQAALISDNFPTLAQFMQEQADQLSWLSTQQRLVDRLVDILKAQGMSTQIIEEIDGLAEALGALGHLEEECEAVADMLHASLQEDYPRFVGWRLLATTTRDRLYAACAKTR